MIMNTMTKLPNVSSDEESDSSGFTIPFKKKKKTKHNYESLRKSAICSLSRELRLKRMVKKNVQSGSLQSYSWEDKFVTRAAGRAKDDALHQLLAMCACKHDCENDIVPDQDRAIVSEAIRSGFEMKLIKLLLEDYPSACESGGCVDHINHPIHIACTKRRELVLLILKTFPDCVNQCNEEGKLPFELFLENKDTIDLTSEQFISTINMFSKLNPQSTNEIYERCRESLKQEIVSDWIYPAHLEHKEAGSS